MVMIDRVPFLKRMRLTQRAMRLRSQRIRLHVPPPWMLPDQHCLIASFPRSGNTWLSHMVADVLLQQRGYETQTKPPINEREIIPDLDRGDLMTCRHADFAPRLIAKTHLESFSWMQKAIFLIRQPADALLSYFHFHKRCPERVDQIAGGLRSFCRRFAEQWYTHSISFVWRCENDPSHFRPVTYESMLERPEDVLAKVLQHLEIVATTDEINKAVFNHQFAKHSRRENKTGHSSFFRKGKKDSALEEMESDLVHWINQVCWPLYERAATLGRAAAA